MKSYEYILTQMIIICPPATFPFSAQDMDTRTQIITEALPSIFMVLETSML